MARVGADILQCRQSILSGELHIQDKRDVMAVSQGSERRMAVCHHVGLHLASRESGIDSLSFTGIAKEEKSWRTNMVELPGKAVPQRHREREDAAGVRRRIQRRFPPYPPAMAVDDLP